MCRKTFADVGRQRGFLLLEVLLAAGLLVMALLALAGLLLRVEADAARVRHYQQARHFAAECLARQQYRISRSGRRLLPSGSWLIGPDLRAGEERREGLQRRYRCDWRVSRRAADVYRLLIEVSWQEAADGPRDRFRLQTQVSSRPYYEMVGQPWP